MTCRVGVFGGEDGFQPFLGQCMYVEVSLVCDADRDAYRTFFWNFPIVGLLISQITEGGDVLGFLRESNK